MTELHRVVFGGGQRVIFVHADGPAWSEETFSEQRCLLDEFEPWSWTDMDSETTQLDKVITLPMLIRLLNCRAQENTVLGGFFITPFVVRGTMVRVLLMRERLVPTDDPAWGGDPGRDQASTHRFLHERADPASAVGVNAFNAKATGHRAPSSRFAVSLKSDVAPLGLNFCAFWKKQTTFPSLAYTGIPYPIFGERAGALALMIAATDIYTNLKR